MGRIVINETENKQTVILNDSPEGVEGGYFDGEEVWHEFGGEYGEITPILNITVQNDNTSPYTFAGELLCIVENNNVLYKEISVASGESDSFTVLVIGETLDDFTFTSLSGNEIFSDMVNCTYDEDSNIINITDPTKNASIHLVMPDIGGNI